MFMEIRGLQPTKTNRFHFFFLPAKIWTEPPKYGYFPSKTWDWWVCSTPQRNGICRHDIPACVGQQRLIVCCAKTWVLACEEVLQMLGFNQPKTGPYTRNTTITSGIYIYKYTYIHMIYTCILYIYIYLWRGSTQKNTKLEETNGALRFHQFRFVFSISCQVADHMSCWVQVRVRTQYPLFGESPEASPHSIAPHSIAPPKKIEMC